MLHYFLGNDFGTIAPYTGPMPLSSQITGIMTYDNPLPATESVTGNAEGNIVEVTQPEKQAPLFFSEVYIYGALLGMLNNVIM